MSVCSKAGVGIESLGLNEFPGNRRREGMQGFLIASLLPNALKGYGPVSLASELG